jgi:transcription antitermination factor NusG
MPRGTVDPYVHLEVKVHKGPLRGVIGTVKNTENNGTRLLIATEGRAVNGYVHIDVEHVRERQ